MKGMSMRNLWAMAFGLAALAGCSAKHIDWQNTGARSGTGFQTRQLQFDGGNRNYTVFVPHSYSPQQRYPVIMFLHGVLEAGSDGRKCVKVGLGPAIQERASTFPFIAVFPQSGGDWQGEGAERLALATLDEVLKDYPAADPDRVVLTGLSNGGDGTWSIGAKYTSRFAALVPMCGAGKYDDVPRLTKIPIWCFHNSGDPFRSSGKAKGMCERIAQAGGTVKYTQYSDIGHDCWTRTYREGEVFEWMKAQRRAGGAAAAVP